MIIIVPTIGHYAEAQLNAFFAAITDLDSYLYSHSICDIANEAEVTPDDVLAWLKAYMEDSV